MSSNLTPVVFRMDAARGRDRNVVKDYKIVLGTINTTAEELK